MQVVPQSLIDNATGQVRPISWALRISFDKAYDDDTTFFTLDTSLLDGVDVLPTSTDNIIQQWDYYKYLNFTDRVQSLEWSREIEFPDSVSSAMADFTLNNYDDYFTPDSGSPIDQYILPKRPVRILSGFKDITIPQFVGMTEKMPIIEDSNKLASFHAIDFLSKMYEMKIDQTIAMQDVRTDEVLVQIFTQLGLTPTQYSLAEGSNIIPFLFFEKDTTVGTILRQLMQAEMGNLWLNEEGIIVFSPRVNPVQSSVFSFDDTNTIDITSTADDNIINTVNITADVREVQENQIIYSKPDTDTTLSIIPANGTGIFTVDLTDPCISIEEPTLGANTGVSWFTATKTDTTNVTSGVTVTGVSLRTNTYVIFFANSNAFDVNINQMELFGEPAKIIDTIQYTEIDQTSIDKFEEKVLDINNPFIQSEEQARILAQSILLNYREYSNQVQIEVKSYPPLQLDDIITLNTGKYNGTYKIKKIVSKIIDGKYSQNITAVKYILREWFYLSSDTVDMSLLDGIGLLTP